MTGSKGPIRAYRLQIDPILEDLETSLHRLGDADMKIAGDLQHAEESGDSIMPVGVLYLEVFKTLRDRIEKSKNEMSSLSPPPSLRVFQAIYVKALDTCLESVSYRIEACEHIVKGDSAEAEKALRQVKPLTDEFKRIEEEALKNME